MVTEGHNPYIRLLQLNLVFLGLKFVSMVGGSVKNNFVNNSITNYNIYYSTIPDTFTNIIAISYAHMTSIYKHEKSNKNKSIF